MMVCLFVFLFNKGFVVSFPFLFFDGFIVTFVSLPGSDYRQVRQCKGVVVDALHVGKKNKTKLLALQNLSTVIHLHFCCNNYPVTLIQTPLVDGKCASCNSKQLYFSLFTV